MTTPLTWRSQEAHGPRMSVVTDNLARLLLNSLRKLGPKAQWHNPILFLVWCGAILTTAVAIAEVFLGAAQLSGGAGATGASVGATTINGGASLPGSLGIASGSSLPNGFSWAIAVWLWLTVLLTNVAESLAEGLGRSEIAALRRMRDTITAHRVPRYDDRADAAARVTPHQEVASTDLQQGDVVVLQAGDIVPADGTVIWGIASVNEAAITGESAPVIHEPGPQRSAVTGGTTVVSDRIVVRITSSRGRRRIDRIFGLTAGTTRQKARNELALLTLLGSISATFVLTALTLDPIASPVAQSVAIPVLVALFACLVPTTIAALLPATGIAGMYQLLRRGAVVGSSSALDAVTDVTTVLLDKTGTITKGDRQASRFVALTGVADSDLVHAAVLASLGDSTSEGTSTLELARRHGAEVPANSTDTGRVVPFSAQTRMSGRDLPDGTRIRKGSRSAIMAWLKAIGSQQPRAVVDELAKQVTPIAEVGFTPLVVAMKRPGADGRVLGVIELKDEVKEGVAEHIAQLHALGLRTVMVTGDNPLTAGAIAQEVGIEDYHGDATPEAKLALIKQEQEAGHFVAMSGDGTNDAPALAQADVGIAMASATVAATRACNIIATDNDPTKFVEIMTIARQRMITRGALLTFSIASDLAKYFAIIPAIFAGVFPGLEALNIVHLSSPASAVLSTVIFNALIIGVLIPLAMVTVPYRMTHLPRALTQNMLVYGVGGIVIPLAGIKAVDLVISLFPGY